MPDTETAAAGEAPEAAQPAADWTADPATGRANASPRFRHIAAEVAGVIREEFTGVLNPARVERAAALIVAQLAHVHHLAPPPVQWAGMRLVRDVDDFQVGTGEDGDVVLRCPSGDGTRTYWTDNEVTLGKLIGDAYGHIDMAHRETR